MSALKSTVRRIIDGYEDGAWTKPQTLLRLTELVAEEGPAEVVAAVPDSWREHLIAEFRELAASDQPVWMLSGGIYAFEVEPDPVKRAEGLRVHEAARAEQARVWNEVIVPAIREWLGAG